MSHTPLITDIHWLVNAGTITGSQHKSQFHSYFEGFSLKQHFYQKHFFPYS